MYFNTTMSNSFFIVSITGLILFCIYFSMFLVQKFIDCETETGQISEKECCEGTWRGLTSSVILVLILTGIVTIISFAIFFFTVRYFYSLPPSTTIQNLSTSIQPLRDIYSQAKQNISPQPQIQPQLSKEELAAMQQNILEKNEMRYMFSDPKSQQAAATQSTILTPPIALEQEQGPTTKAVFPETIPPIALEQEQNIPPPLLPPKGLMKELMEQKIFPEKIPPIALEQEQGPTVSPEKIPEAPKEVKTSWAVKEYPRVKLTGRGNPKKL